MTNGYDKPLYILPFDHRHSYLAKLFHWQEPLSAEQAAEVASSKQVIYEGFKAAVADGVPRDRAGILVDEEFGAAILRDAASHGTITCMPVEKSGQEEFELSTARISSAISRTSNPRSSRFSCAITRKAMRK